MTPVAKRYLLLLLGLILLILAICMIPSVRSRLTEIVGSWFSYTIPGKDNFEDAEVIRGPSGVIVRSNADAGTQAGEPNHRGLPPCKSIWFRWTAQVEGDFIFNTERSAIQTVLAVYDARTLQAIPGSPKIILNRENDYSQFVFNAKKDRIYHIVVNGRGCAPGTSRNSGDGRQDLGAAGMSASKAFYTSAENPQEAPPGPIVLEWRPSQSVVIAGTVIAANGSNVSGVTLTLNPCATNPSHPDCATIPLPPGCATHPCPSNPSCNQPTDSNGKYKFSGFSPIHCFTIEPKHTDYNFVSDTVNTCTWSYPHCIYSRNTGNAYQGDYKAYRNPTLSYNPTATKDCVGQGDIALAADRSNDGIFTLQFPLGSGSRTITKMEMSKTPSEQWDTISGGGGVLGVANSIAGTSCALLNNSKDASINQLISDGATLYLFAADRLPSVFNGAFTLRISFLDGGMATVSYPIIPTPTPVATVSP